MVQGGVTIWYRGARYQLGRGQHGYAIWAAGGPPAQPLEWWPETRDGWAAAWARFALGAMSEDDCDKLTGLLTVPREAAGDF